MEIILQFASHDEAIIEYTKKLAEEHNIPRDQFEFRCYTVFVMSVNLS